MATPTIISITPNFCAQTTQANISIVGTNFGAFSKVFFGNVEAASVAFVSPTNLTAVAPTFPIASSCNVSVKNITGEVSAETDKSIFYFLPTEAGLSSIDANNQFFPCASDFTVFGTWNFKVPPKGIVVSDVDGIFDNLTVNVQSNLKGATVFSGLVAAVDLETINVHSSINNILTTEGTFNIASVNQYVKIHCPSTAMQLDSKGLDGKFAGADAHIYGDSLFSLNLDTFKQINLSAAELMSFTCGTGQTEIKSSNVSGSLKIIDFGIVIIEPQGNLQLGGNATDNINFGSTNTSYFFTTDTTKNFKISGLPSVAPGGTIKALLIETDGVNKGQIFIST